jgi:hypothetical protein
VQAATILLLLRIGLNQRGARDASGAAPAGPQAAATLDLIGGLSPAWPTQLPGRP